MTRVQSQSRRVGPAAFIGRTLEFDRFGLVPGRRLALLYAIFALIATVLLSALMPPFQNPDETNHMLRADQISRLGLVGFRYRDDHDSGGIASPGIAAASAYFDAIRFNPNARVTQAALVQAASVPWGDPSLQGYLNTAIYPPFFYLPAAAAIAAGRASGFGIIQTLKLARLATAIVSVAIGAAAVAIAGRGGVLVAALLCLPMSLELMAAVSQDGPMLASAALAGALLWRGASGRLPRFGLWFLVLCLSLGLIVAARPPYLPLALLPLALRRELRLRLRLAGAAMIAAIGLGWSWVAYSYAEIDTAAMHGGSIHQQIDILLQHPWRLASLATNTLAVNGRFYLESFLGRLGWLDTVLPPSYRLAALIVLILAVLAAGSRPAPLGLLGALVIVLAGAGAIGGVFLIQYLTWTAVGAPVVDAVYGRYLLPIALCLVPLTVLLPRLGPFDRVLRAVVSVFPVVSLAIMLRTIVLRYYLQ